MRKSLFLSVLFVLVAACGGRDNGFLPERLLSEQEMITLMTDVQIIEADINYQKMKERERDPEDTTKVVPKDYVKLSRAYYDQLFEHYGINDSIFTQNMRYYSEHPDVLERIMDSVTNRLTKEQSVISATP